MFGHAGEILALEEGSCRISELWRDAGDMMGGQGVQTLHRFRFDLAGGRVAETTVDERGMDFPRVADARVGLKNRYGYTLLFGGPTQGFAGHLKFDFRSGRSEQHAYEGGQPGEPCFVAAPGADPDSDEGWILSYVYDARGDASELVILDASDFSGPAVARVKLPRRVPFGFHGSWVPDAQRGSTGTKPAGADAFAIGGR